MSRDFTPNQLMAAERALGLFSEKIVFTETKPDGTKKEMVVSDPECEQAKRYPRTYFLGGRILDEATRLIEEGKLERGDLDEFESTLQRITKDEEDGVDLRAAARDGDELRKTATAWYFGELREGYYREPNDEALVEWLLGRRKGSA